jgi:hypothetical protein
MQDHACRAIPSYGRSAASGRIAVAAGSAHRTGESPGDAAASDSLSTAGDVCASQRRNVSGRGVREVVSHLKLCVSIWLPVTMSRVAAGRACPERDHGRHAIDLLAERP